jgi:hypothetical protein
MLEKSCGIVDLTLVVHTRLPATGDPQLIHNNGTVSQEYECLRKVAALLI